MEWKEMSVFYKVVFVVGMLCGLAGLTLSFLDWKGILTFGSPIGDICTSAFCLAEGIINWKAHRKLAIGFFVLAGLRLLFL